MFLNTVKYFKKACALSKIIKYFGHRLTIFNANLTIQELGAILIKKNKEKNNDYNMCTFKAIDNIYSIGEQWLSVGIDEKVQFIKTIPLNIHCPYNISI